MSNSTSNLDLISAGQAQKEVTANAMFDAASPAMVLGRRASTTAALTWGYYGGTIAVSGASVQIASGTLALTASATNYIEATIAGAVSVNTTGFTAGRKPLYTVVTGASADGVWVRIFAPPAEGKLVSTSPGFKVGDKVRVKLVSTNVERGFIDFVLGL